MATPTADITGFTEEQKRLFTQAAELGSGVQTTDNGVTKTIGAPKPITPDAMSGTESPYKTGMFGVEPPPDTSGLDKLISSLTTGSPEQTQAQEAQKSTLQTIQDTMAKLLGEGARKSELETTAGLPDLNKTLAELTNQIRQNNAGAFSAAQTQEDRLAPTFAIQGTQAQIERQRAVKNYGLAAAAEAVQGNIALAQDNIQRALDAEFKPLERALEFQKLFLEQNRADLERADKKTADKLNIVLAERERILNSSKLEKEAIYTALSTAAQYGAPQSVLSAIQNATTYSDAILAAGQYLQDPKAKYQLETAKTESQLKALELARTKAGVGSKAPEVKTINGTDMQWDGEKNKWVPIDSASTIDNTQKSIDQLNFLKDTAQKAKELSSASGVSGASRFIGDVVIGDTKFRQLEALTNTLKVNVLSLMTDPSIKKFFGPQMSNADVLLMTSSGTTLNPSANSPTQMYDEITRLEELFNRMQTAVSNGGSTQSGANLITAPDGQVIEIVD